MKLTTLPKEFIKAKPVMKKIEDNGFEAYFVGGSVRDFFLGKTIHDVDIATSAYPEEIKAIFPRTIDIGIEHGTVLVLYDQEEYEITTFRTESTYQDYRRPDTVTFVRSLEEDLRRRDFTINALALNAQGELTDLFHGMEDIEGCLIKAVGDPNERFHEDALRMMRALRFASQLDFSIDARTLSAIHANYLLLSKISIERIHVEFVKLMLGKNRQNGLQPFIETKAFTQCPGMEDNYDELIELSQLPKTILKDEPQVWLLTVIILKISQKNVRNFLTKWKCSNQMIRTVEAGVEGVNYRKNHESWSPILAYQLGREIIELVEATLPLLMVPEEKEASLTIYDELPIHSLKEMNITGTEIIQLLDRKPGPWVGEMLTELEELVIHEQLENTNKAMVDYIQMKK